MQCINCGKKLTNNTKYCNSCGKYQPLAEPLKETTRPVLANLSVIFLVVGLIPIPILLIGIMSLLFAGTISQTSIIEILLSCLKLSFFACGIPFILALICRLFSEKNN